MAVTDYAIHFKSKMCKIMSPLPAHKVIATIMQINRLYSIPTSVQPEMHIVKLSVSDLHRTICHVAQPTVIDTIHNQLIEGIEPIPTSKPEFCEACTKAKAI
jgi:hypothetical protein